MTNFQTESLNFNFKWGEIKLSKLPKEIDIKRIKQSKLILADEPLLPNILSSDYSLVQQNSLENKHKNDNENKPNANKSYKLKPSIDSYIINTIKLNQLLKNKISFDQVNFFMKSKKKKNKKEKKEIEIQPNIKTEQDALFYLKQFIMIMSIHGGFNKISSFALDTLVDVLDHFIESFLKLFKNLQNIQKSDLNSNEFKYFNSFYSSDQFIEQALEESGLGTIQEIKEFYINDIILYFRDTYKKVSKLYEEYKNKKHSQQNDSTKNNLGTDSNNSNLKMEHDIHLEEFMRDNDFLNDESNSILGELLNNLNVTHPDDDMNKILQIIGNDPFSLITEDFQINSENENQ